MPRRRCTLPRPVGATRSWVTPPGRCSVRSWGWTGILLGLGLLLGLAVAPVLAVYARSEPSVLWQAASATAAFVGALGSYGYATRRDLSSWVRTLIWGCWA